MWRQAGHWVPLLITLTTLIFTKNIGCKGTMEVMSLGFWVLDSWGMTMLLSDNSSSSWSCLPTRPCFMFTKSQPVTNTHSANWQHFCSVLTCLLYNVTGLIWALSVFCMGCYGFLLSKKDMYLCFSVCGYSEAILSAISFWGATLICYIIVADSEWINSFVTRPM